MKTPLLGVLASGSGTNLQAIIEAIEAGTLATQIACVISNNPDAYALKRAQAHHIPTLVINHRDFSNREDFEKALIAALEPCQVNLIVLAGFMRILSPTFVRHYEGRIMNIHPALLPAFPGVNAIQQAYDSKSSVTGVTVHFVDEGMDTGPIILQKEVLIDAKDSLEALAEKIHQTEHQLYPQAIQLFTEERLEIQGGKVLIKGATG
jgi:phosphoribosylglycinamide formyltransferase 1